MVKKRLALPRLINIAIGLTVATLLAAFVAHLLPEPPGSYTITDPWAWASGLGGLLFIAAIIAWGLVIVMAIIRWNSDFPGY